MPERSATSSQEVLTKLSELFNEFVNDMLEWMRFRPISRRDDADSIDGTAQVPESGAMSGDPAAKDVPQEPSILGTVCFLVGLVVCQPISELRRLSIQADWENLRG